MWQGANISAPAISKIDLLITPLNKNKTDGKTDNVNALSTLFFPKKIIQPRQYSNTRIQSTMRYITKISSDQNPNQVPGILIIIKPKQLNLPICSIISIFLLIHKLSNPFFTLIAKIMFGIIIIARKPSP